MKRIIDIPDEVLESKHYCQYFGAWSTKLTELIEQSKPYDDSGDLISCEALKEAINITDFDFGDYYDNTEEIRKRVCEAIDNAPTVDIKDEIAGAYNEGFMCGNKEAEKVRPQGVWTTDEKGYFYCDQCGKYPHDQYATTDFCPKCGADMRKGGADMREGDNK